MQRFKFSLETLLTVKRRQLQQAELCLAQRQLALDAAEDQRRYVDSQFDALSRSRSGLVGRGSVDVSLQAGAERSELLFRKLQSAREHVRAARAERDEAVQGVTRLKTEVKALESLRDTAWVAYSKKIEQQHQHQLDEFVMRSWDADGAPQETSANA